MIDKHESITSKICSFVRAYHSTYASDVIFDDYLAYDLMGQDEYLKIGQLIENNFDIDKYDPLRIFNRSKIENVVNHFLSAIPLVRSRYAQNKLIEFATKHKQIQYVILGAGLDTFSFRNSQENIEIYELDHPDTGNYKRNKIKELEWVIPSNVHFVGIDFNTDKLDQTLVQAGFKKDIPTFFSLLGVTYYLSLDTLSMTLNDVSSITKADTQIVFDYPDETTLNSPSSSRVYKLAQMTKILGETMVHGYSRHDIKHVFELNGFSFDEHITPEEIQNSMLQNRTDGILAYENVHMALGHKRCIK